MENNTRAREYDSQPLEYNGVPRWIRNSEKTAYAFLVSDIPCVKCGCRTMAIVSNPAYIPYIGCVECDDFGKVKSSSCKFTQWEKRLN